MPCPLRELKLIFPSLACALLASLSTGCETLDTTPRIASSRPAPAPERITGPYRAGHNRTPYWADMLFEAEAADIAIARSKAAMGDREARAFLDRVEERHEWQRQHWNDEWPFTN